MRIRDHEEAGEKQRKEEGQVFASGRKAPG